jgi:hypothetical protein
MGSSPTVPALLEVRDGRSDVASEAANASAATTTTPPATTRLFVSVQAEPVDRSRAALALACPSRRENADAPESRLGSFRRVTDRWVPRRLNDQWTASRRRDRRPEVLRLVKGALCQAVDPDAVPGLIDNASAGLAGNALAFHRLIPLRGSVDD